MRLAWVITVCLMACAAACSDAPQGDGGIDGGNDVTPIFADAGCMANYAQWPQDPGLHVDTDASITWSTNPPSSGTHFPIWAHWGVHSEVVPRGYYVHNEEHGGVVVLYRCIAADCATTRQQLEAFVASLPAEAACASAGVHRRIVLTEDPLIDSPIAAAAWGYTYRAQCFDDYSLRAFVLARTGMGPEQECLDGFYP